MAPSCGWASYHMVLERLVHLLILWWSADSSCHTWHSAILKLNPRVTCIRSHGSFPTRSSRLVSQVQHICQVTRSGCIIARVKDRSTLCAGQSHGRRVRSIMWSGPGHLVHCVVMCGVVVVAVEWHVLVCVCVPVKPTRGNTT
jgi:hypothetical protein